MKKILFSLALMIGFTVAANAQTSAATSTPGNVPTKPKTAVEASKANGTAAATVTPKDTTKTATVATEKKCAKKSCCKKEDANAAKAESCSHDKAKGGACCKDKKVEATKKD